MARRLNVPARYASAVWAALLTAWASWPTGGRLFGPLIELLHSVYPGYAAGFFGGILGLIWGFIDGLIMGAAIALVYNRVAMPIEERPGTTGEDDDLL